MNNNQKIQLTYIIDSLAASGGAERMLFELATRVGRSSSGFAVEVIAFGGQKGDHYYDTLVQAGISVTIIPKKSKIGISLYTKCIQHLRKTKPDIVHTHLFAADVWGGYAAHRAGVPVILSTEHNINHNEGWLKHRLKCYTHHYRNRIIAVSKAVESSIQKECSAAEGKTAVIYNGVDVQQFSSLSIARETKANAPARIAVIGRLEEQKGHSDLLNALPLVQEPFTLAVYGAGSLHHQLQQQITTLGLSDRVQFKGVHNSIEQVYAHTDIVIIPSRWEGFGLVAVEALAAGRAVLASRVDGLTEIIQDQHTGILVDMQNTQEVARQIDRLIAQPQLRFELGEAGRKDVVHRFSIEQMIDQYTVLYKSFL